MREGGGVGGGLVAGAGPRRHVERRRAVVYEVRHTKAVVHDGAKPKQADALRAAVGGGQAPVPAGGVGGVRQQRRHGVATRRRHGQQAGEVAVHASARLSGARVLRVSGARLAQQACRAVQRQRVAGAQRAVRARHKRLRLHRQRPCRLRAALRKPTRGGGLVGGRGEAVQAVVRQLERHLHVGVRRQAHRLNGGSAEPGCVQHRRAQRRRRAHKLRLRRPRRACHARRHHPRQRRHPCAAGTQAVQHGGDTGVGRRAARRRLHVIQQAHRGEAVAGRVLHQEAGAARRAHNQLVLVKPAVGAVAAAVQEAGRLGGEGGGGGRGGGGRHDGVAAQRRRRRRRMVIQRHHPHGGVNGCQAGGIDRRGSRQLGARVRPGVPVARRQRAQRVAADAAHRRRSGNGTQPVRNGGNRQRRAALVCHVSSVEPAARNDHDVARGRASKRSGVVW